MSLNGVSGVSNTSTTTKYADTAAAAEKKSTENKDYGKDAAAVYKPSAESKTAKSNSALVAKLKADQQNRLTQMQNLVKDMFQKQGKAFSTSDQMWKMLANGDFTVDPETAKAAKEAISDDGYWGVNQTSQRIFDFAQALSGGDEKKMDEMLEAFKKGFGQATKAWGKSLPDISQRTYDSVLEKFEDYKKSLTTETE